MVLEIAFIEVAPSTHSEFELAVKKAVDEVLSKAVGFIDFQMHIGIEQENTYTFHIQWKTLEDHTIGFRQGPLFPQWRSIIGEFFAKPPVVEHWDKVTFSH
jgi:quinol monooxygenase YgiN